ncbi:MAG: carboxypeptidase-like regulatory domain-containing protein [Saprospiraceae bacterium]|nr:carboxypeptidase-like regulatory domain-containing protein [Saprospiraceae bacterium]
MKLKEIRVYCILLFSFTLLAPLMLWSSEAYTKHSHAELGAVQDLEKTLTGTVRDSDGNPLVGATVLAKGTSQGTVTDAEGKFQLTVADDVTTLVISYVGYTEQEVEIGGRTMIDVIVLESASTLDEVIVVGYASQRKINLTGSVSTIRNEELTSVPSANMSQSLTGKAPGLITLVRESRRQGS